LCYIFEFYAYFISFISILTEKCVIMMK